MMFLTEISHFPSFSSFRVAGKRSQPKNNLDLISRSFEDNLLLRLKTLNSNSNPPSVSLSWLSLAVDFLSSTHAEAKALISNLNLNLRLSGSSDNNSLASYLDDSVKFLDVCNSISFEIERLRQRRLLINFVLHLLEFTGESRQIPATEKLRRARDSLRDWENCSGGGGFTKKPRFQKNNDTEILMRDLAVGLGSAPRGKISSVKKLVSRTIYAVEAVTVFVAGAAMAALYGLPEIITVRVPTEFVWADSFNDLESLVSGDLKRRFSGEKKRLFRELDDVETRIRRVCDVIDGVVEADKDKDNNNNKERLENAVKELETVTETFSDGLDRLCNGVNGMFHTVLCTRNGMLEKFRVGQEKGCEK